MIFAIEVLPLLHQLLRWNLRQEIGQGISISLAINTCFFGEEACELIFPGIPTNNLVRNVGEESSSTGVKKRGPSRNNPPVASKRDVSITQLGSKTF
ncbi:hypothetical protein AVEN_51437-1 [Araneus ventricosus]|uniref:Uncharacterized protein n=1 Tax=Araneus ventricosus TaxID=182803 RepID=A0A4Y2G785_ARAVE|nr:hypothetical protein AVEN_51437-1 [Araneus ventricosus]